MYDFERANFFPFKRQFKLKDLDKILSYSLIESNIVNNYLINDISSLRKIRNNSLIFLKKEINNLNLAKKNVHIITNVKENINYYDSFTLVKDLNSSFNTILNKLFLHEDQTGYLDEYDIINGSYISKFSNIDKSVEIGRNSLVARGVEIGKNCIIKNNVVIKNSILKTNVVVCDNTSIGTTGFGFDFKNRGSTNLNPQIGIVIIDDNVHIGSCCTIDRGKIDFTYIGKNSMIDNMVHIAHNVIIGESACIAAQTGISGSVTIGDNVTIGGQVGFAGHIKIGDNAVIAAKSGVTKNIKDNSRVAGFPAIDINEWKKNLIRQKKNGYK